jgi:microcystin-dependent protein
VTDPFLGELRAFALPPDKIPAGWSPCDGTLLPIGANNALFALIGRTYGGDGTTQFALPDLRGAMPICARDGAPMGERVGEWEHTLTETELPKHRHTLQGTNAPASDRVPTGGQLAAALNLYTDGAATTSLHPETVAGGGNGAAHSNISPHLVVTWCICTTGIFPDAPEE